VGTGANGKSVITEALSNAIGEEVCSALSLHQICGNERKHIHRLPYKLLNVATETDTSTISNTSVFKNVVSGEVFETEILYQKAGFKTQTNVKLCFLMNNLPRLKHGTEGDLRRIRVLHFSNRFSGEDRDSMLRQKLRAERGGILAYLIRRLPRVCLLEELPYGSFESQKMLSTFAGNTDIILTFFAQCAEIAPYGNSKRDPRRKIISKQNLYNVFCRFCRRNDQGVRLGNSQFFKIARQLYPQLDWDHNIDHGKLGRGACVRGLRFSEYGYELFYGDET
jgi:phage/plasmid-associated DNA primase